MDSSMDAQQAEDPADVGYRDLLTSAITVDK